MTGNTGKTGAPDPGEQQDLTIPPRRGRGGSAVNGYRILNPFKLTEAVAQELEDAVRVGAVYSIAAAAAGISYDSLDNWLKEGGRVEEEIRTLSLIAKPDAEQKKELAQKRRHPCFLLLVRLRSAKGEGAKTQLERIASAGKEDWRANTWLLERSYPQVYGRRVTEHRIAPELKAEAKRLADMLGMDPEALLKEAALLAGEELEEDGDARRDDE